MKIGNQIVQLSRQQAELVLTVAEHGRTSYHQLLNSREDNGRIRTIHALCEKGILRHAPRVGGWDCYVHVLTPLGKDVAIKLLIERMSTMVPQATVTSL